MATSWLQWGPLAAEPPSADAPQPLTIHTTALRPVLAFDASTDETVYLSGILPQGFSGTPELRVRGVMASATSGAVRLKAAVEAITPADAVDLDAAESFDTDNTAGSGAVPATAGHEFEVTISLSSVDSWAAGDRIRIRFGRDADGTSGTDDATGDFYWTFAELRA